MTSAHLRPRPSHALLVGAFALSFAACGDDSQSAGTVPSSGSSIPGTTTPPTTSPDSTPATSAPIEHPVGADDVVVRIAYEGGFVPVEVAFRTLPTLLVTGDGRLVVTGPQIEIYPQPLLPNLQVRTISEAGIQRLLDMAVAHGLLAHREYTDPTNVADAPDTVVVITANGETYEHRAYALGIDDANDELREALADFVAEATGDWLSSDNPELGAEQPYTSETFLVRPMLVTDTSGDEIEPTVTDWPAGLEPLVDGVCTEVPADFVAGVFAEADQLTLFTSAGQQYQLAVKPQLPGDSC